MKKVFRDKIINIWEDTQKNTFLFEQMIPDFSWEGEVVFMRDKLEEKKNEAILAKTTHHPAMWSEVYSPKDELAIFTEIFEKAIQNKKKVHIVGITLKEEIEMLEKYYESLGFMREDINCFQVDFSQVLVSVSIYLENIMWRGSDYKRLGKNIFRNPPIREAGQVKWLFKGINRGVIAGVITECEKKEMYNFLEKQVLEEHILPLTLGKILFYNFEDIGFSGKKEEIKIEF